MPDELRTTTYGFEARSEINDPAELGGVASSVRQVAPVTLARALLGKIAAGESIGADELEALAFAVLDADAITRLAVAVVDASEPHRLTRAIELAARVIQGEARADLTFKAR